ncbi:protein N-terminal glutamine amidohydrolase-like [Lineus longissimus]|uniref:protein N-terminal glutamine amidohydrolase-like n=1 Tax=Lineus longissimus TaxID=88925 RepID=UPI00315D5E78
MQCLFQMTKKKIPIWRQQACLEPENPIVWDYHVIFVRCRDCGSELYDLDTQLPFPCELNKYVEEALCYDDKLEAKYRRSFRVIPAVLYLEKFASDRSHMLDDDGIFRTDPPTYPCITTPEIQNNLEDFINMDPAVGYGEIVTLRKFVSKFNSAKTKNR